VNDEASALHADPERAFDGQYQLGAEIGAGALGVVYRGVDERLDKPVAIKVWHARLDDQAPLREQYDTEARALTALEHPNVVAITDYGIAGQAPYLVMELLEGQTLGARMRAGALPSALTQTFMQSVLRGLGYMHMRGVIHRNLNPDNVYLHKLDADSEQLKLLDLRLEALPANTNAEPEKNRRTAYDAPEQDSGIDPDGRSDVYAAGVMMLHMLSGREPTRELVRAVADSADLLENVLPSATPEVRAFIARAVAPERAGRFGNADQMLRALLELATPWADDPPGAVAAPAPNKATSPEPEPAHAELDLSATALGKGETIPLSAAEGGEHAPEQGQSDEDMVLGPIGLMAKLRARKRLLLIGGGVLGLAASSGVVAMVLSSRGSPEHAAQEPEAGEEHAQADKAKDAKGSKAAAAPAPEADKEEEEEEEEEATPLIKRAEPGAEHAQAEAPRYSARLGDSAEPGAKAAEAEEAAEKATTPTEVAVPAAKPAEGEAAAKMEAKPGSEHEAAASPATTVPGEPPPTAAAHDKPAAAVSGKVEPPSTPAPAPAPAPVAAKAEEPKPPTPEQIGSERHIELDKNEIRQMLALAIAPKSRVAARNPWNIEVPGSLQALRDAITKGERGSAGNLKALRSYNATNPDDVYGHLLLGGFYANRGFSLDALDQYDMAYRIDPSSRGAPEMLKHALGMVAQGIAETDAARFVERVFGREALTAIAQRAQARDTNAAAARRLKQLQARIAGGKRR
jgi:serine/threonine-protein kinase